MINHQEYLKLISEINRLRNEVHLFNNEEISESALDDLKHKISQYEQKNPEKISANSPNYNVAGGVLEKFEKFTHLRRMLSLNDIFDLRELQEWEERWQNFLQKNYPEEYKKYFGELEEQSELLFPNQSEKEVKEEENHSIEYICEPKLDGLALSLHYEDGKLVAAATRGDGWVGELVTENARQIRNIPKEIPDKRKLEVRGEVFITRENFNKLNQEISEGLKIGKGGKTGSEAVFANSRNVSSGTLRQLDSRIVAERKLSFVAYNIFINSAE